ncbi:MAG: hypothetical protein ABGW90_13025 [Martelella sp.]
MASKSFRKGFVSGFTSAGNIFVSHPIKRSSRFDGSVEAAWLEVGRALSDATLKQGKVIDKATRAKRRKTNAAA